MLTAMRSSVEALVLALARELAPVRVNAVTPGLIDPPLLHTTDGAGRDTIVQNRATTLSGRYVGTAEEVAQVVLMLMIKGYVTGEVMHLDGGGRCVSHASQRFDQHHWVNEFWEGRATGRLLRYDPRTDQTTVKLDGLRFANGVALGPGDAFVLVNETVAARIRRLWVSGPQAGTHDIFLDGLPGYPDNLSSNGRGLFWVALPAPRVAALEQLAGRPWLRTVLFRLPTALTRVTPEPVGWVLGVDVHGQVRHHLRETVGGYANITSVQEFGGALWLGGLFGRSVGRVPAPAFNARGTAAMHGWSSQVSGAGVERWVAADLVVLAEDRSPVPVERLREVGVAMTTVGGEVVCDEW